jgi:hypothetical protein
VESSSAEESEEESEEEIDEKEIDEEIDEWSNEESGRKDGKGEGPSKVCSNLNMQKISNCVRRVERKTVRRKMIRERERAPMIRVVREIAYPEKTFPKYLFLY